LIVLVWSEVPIFFGVVMSNALVAKGIQKYMAYGAIAGAGVNVLLNLVLIPRYGALGASWATVMSYCIAGIFFPLFLSGVRPIILLGMRIAIGPFLLALVIMYGLKYIALAFWWKLVLAAIAFALGAWATGSVGRKDAERIRQMIKLSGRG